MNLVRGGTCHKNRLHLQYSLQVRKGSRCHEDIVVCNMYKNEVHSGVAAVIYASPERPKVLNFFLLRTIAGLSTTR